MIAFASREIGEDEIKEWADTRADDAGYLARLLLLKTERKMMHGPYGWLIKPIGSSEDEWFLSNDPSQTPNEEISVPLMADEEQVLERRV